MSIKTSPKVGIVILNFNGAFDTIECLESVFQINFDNFLVSVVDNGSTDDSIEKIKKYCNGGIKINSSFFSYTDSNKPINLIEIKKDQIRSKTNYDFNLSSQKSNLFLITDDINAGFSAGNNLAITFFMNFFKPEYLFLLNNDVVVSKNLLIDLIEIADRDHEIGIIGPAVYQYFNRNQIQSAGVLISKNFGIVKTLTFSEKQDKIPALMEVNSLSGCALLIKKQLIENIGLLDADYFAYWEETDLCLRVKEHGQKVVVAPRVKVWHKGGSTSKKIKGFTEYFMVRNKFWFMKAHMNRLQFSSYLVYFFTINFWVDTARLLLLHHNILIYKEYIKGVFDGLKGKNRIK